MTKREYTIGKPYELTGTPISWLEGMPESELSSDDILLVASQPNFEVQDTGYISKKIALKDLRASLADSLSAELLSEQISYLSTMIDKFVDISANFAALNSGTVTVQDAAPSDPYILSSLSYEKGNLVSADGFSLKGSLSSIIPSSTYNSGKFNALSCASLVVNGQSVVPVEASSKDVAGIVKTYKSNETPPSSATAVYVQQDANQRLYVSLNTIVNAVKDALADQVAQEVLAALQKQYYKTVVAAAPPSEFATKTIYYITG